ncbi:MAG: hypothetical protein ATN31_01200 [Candidatus Epulonipiscioides saccharophilum]|nr:MAG: hypothetical protein ATN31_01200 [Epulopiscium sp. AS2M-Bin001]
MENDKEIDYEDLMYACYATSQFQAALNYSYKYLENNPVTMDILLLQARCSTQLENILESLVKYQEIIRKYKDHPNVKEAFLELSVIFYKLGNYKVVIPLLQQAISLGYEESLCLELMADCYLNMEQFDAAANTFIKAVNFSEHKKLVYRNIAECYLHLNQIDLADEYLDLAEA